MSGAVVTPLEAVDAIRQAVETITSLIDSPGAGEQLGNLTLAKIRDYRDSIRWMADDIDARLERGPE